MPDVLAEISQLDRGQGLGIVHDHLRHPDDACQRREKFVRKHHADVCAQLGEFLVRLVANGLLLLESRLDDVDQLADAERLRQVVVGAERHAHAHALEIGAPGHEHEGNVGRAGVGAERGQGVVAVHALHVDVADDNVGHLGAGCLDARFAVDRLHDLIAVEPEALGDRGPQLLLVFND